MSEPESLTYELLGRAVDRDPCHLKARYRRLHTDHAMDFHCGHDVYCEGWLHNRSPLGAMLETCHSVEEGMRLEISFSSSEGRCTFLAQAIVRWVKSHGRDRFRVGLEFETLHQL